MKQVKNKVHYWCPDTRSQRCTGKNIGAAVLDTGIMPHPDFGKRIRAFADCVGGRQGLYDDSGHGTHVAGVLAGNGRMSKGVYAGMAPEADLIIVKVLDHAGQGAVPWIQRGIRWILNHRQMYQIRIVNISVGANLDLDDKKSEELIHAVEELWDAGLVVVVSAGNYGPGEGTVAAPGTSRKIITVGSCDEFRAPAENHIYYSGCGPTRECVMKPDVVAPGYQIISCNSRFAVRGQSPYVVKSGSSMATPVVSGAMALLLDKYRDMSNVETKLRLRECCERLKSTSRFQGWGQINIQNLL